MSGVNSSLKQPGAPKRPVTTGGIQESLFLRLGNYAEPPNYPNVLRSTP